MRLRLNDWERAQPPVQAVDQSNSPLDDGTPGRATYRSEMVDQWRAEAILKQVKKDIDREAYLSVSSDFTPLPGEGRRYWIVNFGHQGTRYSIPAGDLFAEISDPYGWAANDFYSYRIGVDELREDGYYAGSLSMARGDVLQHGRPLPVQWNPDPIVKAPEALAPGSYPPPPGFYWGRDTSGIGLMGELKLMPIVSTVASLDQAQKDMLIASIAAVINKEF